jgi:hypothetical protein
MSRLPEVKLRQGLATPPLEGLPLSLIAVASAPQLSMEYAPSKSNF